MTALAVLVVPAEAQGKAVARGQAAAESSSAARGQAAEGNVAVRGTAARGTGATDECEGARFTAAAQADLAKITVLDAGVLRPDLPALADVRLASARGNADSARRPHRTIATGRYADAKLLGLRVPGVPVRGTTAESRAPGGRGPAQAHAGGHGPARIDAGSRGLSGADAEDRGPAQVDPGSRGPAQAGADAGRRDRSLAGVTAGGLATVQLGKSIADAHWKDAYLCGETGPLTRSATMLAGAQFLGGGGTTPAIRAMRTTGTGAGERTSLLKLGPTGSTQSATDLVRRNGRLAVSAAAGVALSDLTLFAGTSQEVSIKVVTQPTLTVTATGHRAYDEVDYRPAVLRVTAAGRPVATLGTRDTSVGVELFGGLDTRSLLSAKISLGGARQERTGDTVRAEAAALRVEVMLGGAHLLDVALGHLSAAASAPPLLTIPARVKPGATHRAFEKPAAPAATPPAGTPSVPEATTPPVVRTVAEPARERAGALAVTGANVAAAATGGLLLVALGIGAVLLTRRRGRRH